MYYKIHFPADFKNVPPIRDLVYHAACLQGYNQQEAGHMKSVADELIVNAIEYGSQATSEVTFEVFVDEKMVKLICSDQGHGNKLTAKQIEEKIREPVHIHASRGRGITQIVKNFVSELDFRDRSEGGIIATAVIKKTI